MLQQVFSVCSLNCASAYFHSTADDDLDNLIIAKDNPGLVTSGNATITDETTENHNTNIIYAAIIEAFFVGLFAVALYK